MVDSDDDGVEIYGYKQSRQNETQHKSARGKQISQEPEDGGENVKEQTKQTIQNGDSSSSDDLGFDDGDVLEDEEFEDDDGPRHPYYNYATEKWDTHTDAKLIYQRHRLDTKTESESGGSPYLMAKSFTMPAGGHFDNNLTSLGRSPSLSSRRSRPSQIMTGQLGHPAMGPTQTKEPFPSLQESAAAHNRTLQHIANAADAQAREHAKHPNLPHEYKDPLMQHEGMHGAGAGVGLGSGPDGFAKNEGTIVSEVEAICDKIKHILDLRQAYMKVSNQCPGNNPKDNEDWQIYPAPPEPVWTEEKSRPAPPREDNLNSASSSLYIADPKSAITEGLKWGVSDGLKAGSSASLAGAADKTPASPTAARKRRKWGTDIGQDFEMDECEIPGKDGRALAFSLDEGSVYQVYNEKGESITNVPTLRDYYKALDEILDIASDGPAKSFAYRRLQYLEGRYGLYTLLNEYEEVADTKKVPHRDFYNVRKVDTHVHHSACMNQKHLLRFIKSKMKKCPDEIVLDRDGKMLTLSEVFKSIDLTAYDLSIDTLDMHAHTDSFHRFDKFNLKYNPIGQSRLRDIFLKTDNFIKGRYLAEITREVISDLESSKYQMVSLTRCSHAACSVFC